MDGNGRWAGLRGLPRTAGHRAGASAVRRVVATAPRHGIRVLTLYAFSSDNWRRPPLEVAHLFRLLRSHFRSEEEHCRREGVRVSVIGRRDRLSRGLVAGIEAIEEATREGRTLHLQIAVDYSGRDALVEAASTLAREGTEPSSRDALREAIGRVVHAPAPIPDVDLLVRTGGESRLSDFLPWESAYAELLFTPCLWPDFDEASLAEAMNHFASRERRYGGLQSAPTRTAQER